MNYLTHLECSFCRKEHDADRLQTLCNNCGKPLLARYDIDGLKKKSRRALVTGEPSMWRYRAVFPVREEQYEVNLGEGLTPLVPASRLGRKLGLSNLFIKDESQNPTGSFKARGLSMAVSKAWELGADGFVIPSAGNAAGALSAYAARAGLDARVFMPDTVPAPFRNECEALGARVTLVKGLITDCGVESRRVANEKGLFDVSTLKEPYRLEGKKTLGYELAEQFGWELPDVIIYPTGGGTGLVGMWKAFDEMEKLGWISGTRPRMVVVQSDGCAPVVRAFDSGSESAEPWENPHTVAEGIQVPSAVGDFLILKAVRESRGTAVSVSDEFIIRDQMQMSRMEGISCCPEGGATLSALKSLLSDGWISSGESVVIFNTGTGLKYPGVFNGIIQR